MPALSKLNSCRFRAYVSYSHHDEKWAAWLHRKIEGYRLPRRLVGRKTAAGIIPRRIAPVFRDREELPSATDLGETVEKALRDSANLIVICSPSAAASRWVNEEILTFKRLGRSDRIFCFIVDGEPNASDLPGRADEECFPVAIRFRVDAKGETTDEPAEPIAADAREGKDGKTGAKLKLIAGIVGVGFDELRQRDLHRRHYRMATVTAVAMTIMLITTGLAIRALMAEREALEQREQAESLVSFILLDLRQRLEPTGKLDALDAVGEKAMEYFESLDDDSLTTEALAIRSDAMRQIGEVRKAQGRLDLAMEAFKSSLSDAESLAVRDPYNDKVQFLLAQANFWVGYIHLDQGDVDQTLVRFQKYLDISRAQVEEEPQNEEWLRELGYAYTNLGTVFDSQGRAEEALEQFRGAQTIAEALLELDPENSNLLFDVAEATSWVGSALTKTGDLSGALEQFRREVSTKKSLITVDPQNTMWQRRLSLGHRRVGEVLEAQGELQRAAVSYQTASAISVKLASLDPRNAKWQQDVASLQAAEARIELALNDPETAYDKAAGCIQTIEELLAEDSSNTRWQRDIARCRLLTGTALKVLGDIDNAQRLIDGAIKKLDALVSTRPNDTDAIRHLGKAYLIKGQLAAMNGNREEAQAVWLEALKLIGPVAQKTKDYRILNVNAQIFSCLGRIEDAGRIADELTRIGHAKPETVVSCVHEQLSATAD